MATGLEDLLGDGDPAGSTTGRAVTPRHAAAPSRLRGGVGRVLGGALLAVLGVAVGIAALLVLSDGTPAGSGPAVAGPVVAAPTEQPSPTGAVGSEPAATPTTEPAPAAVPAASASPAAAVPPMTVLNNSRVSGLGSRAAETVRAAGFTVSTVGNFTGRIAVTTLYFAPGQDAAAARVAADVAGIERVLPRFDGLPGTGLTLVVTRDFPA